MWPFAAPPPPPPPPPPEYLLPPIGVAILVISATLLASQLFKQNLIELVRRFFTALYHVQGLLPSGIAKFWRLAVTLLMQTIPAVDPQTDPYVTTYKLPRVINKCTQATDSASGVLITGVTGFVGLHLLDHLLRTTSKRLFILVRARSVTKLRREATRYKLDLPGFDGRVTLLDGDCKRADLGLSVKQWAELARSVRSVFHLAANSSFVATYEILRGPPLTTCA